MQVPEGVDLRKVDLSTELQILAYHEQRKNGAALALTAEQAAELAEAVERMSVLAIGVSHRSAPVEVLERVALDRAAVAKLLDEVPSSHQIVEAVVVATCNRLELYPDTATFHGGIDEASVLLSQHTGAPLERSRRTSTCTTATAPSRTCSTWSAGSTRWCVGETQILGQVRDAYRLAQTSGATGRVLTSCSRRRCGSASGRTPRPASTPPAARW